MQPILQPPSLPRDWKVLVVLGLAIFCLSFAARLFDYPKWVKGGYRVRNEWILGTHDAYYWLAGAAGVGRAQNTAPAKLLALAASCSGLSLGDTAFWLPALAAGLTGVATLLWAWTLGCMEAGLLAGILTTLAPGFFYRTRLGCYDTDMATLLFPLLISWSVAAWMRPFLARNWRRPFKKKRTASLEKNKSARPQQIPGTIEYLLISLAGAAAGACASWHVHIAVFTSLLVLLALLFVALQAQAYVRPRLAWGMALFSIGAFCGTPGALAALGAVALWRIFCGRFSRLLKRTWPAVLLVVCLVFFFGAASSLRFETKRFLFTFVKTTAQQPLPEHAQAPPRPRELSYPGSGQSIMEAQSISFPHILKRMHPGLWIPLAGFLGFAALLFFQPLSLFLCSLLFFSLSAHIFGARVTMFGAPALMLGLGFGVSALGKAAFRQLFAHRAALLALLSVLSLALCVPYYHLLRSLAPTPVLGTAHARALLALQGLSPPDSVIWTWWDWGYATNYYTRRVPVADGGNHLGQQLFTLGLVLSTHSPRQANQLIRFSAQEHYRPWEALNQLGPEGAARFLTSLKTTPLPLGTGAKQYLVVTTENFALAPWIEFYGTWDFVRKDGQHARVMRIAPPYQVDYRTGRITKGKHGKQLSLRTIDVLGPNGTKHFQFPKNKVDYNLVLCPGSEESYIVNNLTYGSMMMRLLIDPASPDIAPFFRLAYDGGSTVKIFEVLAPSSGECTSKATGKDTRLYATYSHR